jgi:hypothetical protein
MFDFAGRLVSVETIAVGRKVRELPRLQKACGPGRWRKRTGLIESDYKMAASEPRKSTGTKRTASVARSTRSSGSSRDARGRHVVCVSNVGYAASLEVRKIYTTIRDPAAKKLGFVRVIDESGEDYLYPRAQFSEITLPRGLRRRSRPDP